MPVDAGVEIAETDRGGKSTFHGPGQLVCYPILDLKRHGKDVRKYVRDLEESLVRTLAAFDAAPNGAYLATGQLFPDALAVGAAAGAEGAPLLITREGCVPQPVLDALDALSPTSITLLGGEPSLSLDAARLIACA